MNIILLSGGSGKRLWPLSNDVRSKQFLMLFQNEAGEYESMGPLMQPIAPQMYAVARGTDYVDLDEAAEDYDDGLPMDVSSAVWALWDD